MSSSNEEVETEEEVKFVSESSLRPVLECIDLLSDSEDEDVPMADGIEDEIERQKAQVTSTLDKLALKVAAEKRDRANKCRAFKEKQMSQKAHGCHELAFSSAVGHNQDAKRCVDMWLKMPGVRPGVVNGGFRRGQHHTSSPSMSSSRHTCPVINCGRVFDHVSLLEGHLKRFDHSPCDPTVNLKGSPSELFACVACGQRFDTREAWEVHLQSKVSSSNPGGHIISQVCQLIVCFACPACYLLFSLRDECLQHMAAQNHFTRTLNMTNGPMGKAVPVPFPAYAKSHLISLCKNVAFSVQCNECCKALNSHQEAQAHFNVYCRQGCAVAMAEKTVAQMMKQLQVQGQCSLCCETFLSQREMERHKESTQHEVEVNQTMEEAVLQFCTYGEIQRARRAKRAHEKRPSQGPGLSQWKREATRGDSSPAKRQRLGPALNGCAGRTTLAWVCECGLRFSEEADATKHLFAANQIFHQCSVCGKRMGESSVARLHMSRFHGGAHLSNFLYHCRLCKVDMPRYEDILSHVTEVHSGHTYCTEQEVSEERATLSDAKPSTSGACARAVPSEHRTPAPPKWMCRMCEDTFGSEADVRTHCSNVTSHSFQRFVCGHCPQKFFKESTVRRHCMNEHSEQIKVSFFCGLCDSMQFELEEEFLGHYEKLHSRDFCRVDDDGVHGPAFADESSAELESLCPCMGSEKGEAKRNASYTKCMKNLAAAGKCEYVCAPCRVSVSSFAQIKTHVHSTHAALALAMTFDVVCKACLESFTSVPTFHKHFHSQHCPLAPCHSLQSCGDERVDAATVDTLNAAEMNPDLKDVEDVKLAQVLSMDHGAKDTDAHEDESDEEMKYALALSAEEAKAPSGKLEEEMNEARGSPDLEEALKRSLLDF